VRLQLQGERVQSRFAQRELDLARPPALVALATG
jgi:hypothetical protein